MGCDIHAHLEAKKDGAWHHLGSLDIDRDYVLFAILGGARLDVAQARTDKKIVPMANMSGIPDNASAETRRGFDRDGAYFFTHSPGAIYASQLPRLKRMLEKVDPCYRNGANLEEDVFHARVNDGTLTEHKGWDDLRIVFWFDG